MRTSVRKVLLSGASGMLGSALQRTLAVRNQPVLQLVRRPVASRGQLQWSSAVANPALLENLSAAIHLSGANVAAHRWTAGWKREMTESRVQSTHAIATALSQLNHPPKALLVASAIGFYGNRGDEMLDESSGPGSGFLADLCQQWEAAAQPAVDAGIRVVHLRFGVVLGTRVGSNPGALARMVPIFRLGLGGPLGSGRQWMSWIALTDVLDAILFILESPTLTGPVNLTSPYPVTNADFTRALAAAVHRPAILPVPAFALRLALGEMAREALLASARVSPSKLTDAGFPFTYPAIDQAIAAGLAPPLPALP
jgi:uncharacterized protein